MRLTDVELRRVRLPLVAPFRTAAGMQHERDVLLVRVLGPDVDGWGECVAMAEPTYTAEYVDGAQHVIEHFLLPRLRGGVQDAGDVAGRLAPVQGHHMAKAAIETAVLDAQLRRSGTPLARYLGADRDRVPAGVAVGMQPTTSELLDAVTCYVGRGYRRVKLKIGPGHDVEPVRLVRERFPDLLVQVDANGAYTLADADHLAALDAFALLLVEQPLAAGDLLGHAELARRLRTPVCLDESVVDVHSAALAIRLGACSVVNLKPGRVGGYLEARRIHDLCRAHGVGLWCGGMLETGIGRAGNVALAALPGFTLPGDLSASSRYFADDLTEPFELDDGMLTVPTGPGLGVTVRQDVLAACTTSTRRISLEA